MDNQIKTTNNDKLRTNNESSEFGSQKANYSANCFDSVFSRLMAAVGTKKAVDVANALEISQQSISGAKAKQKIPEGWLTSISDKFGVSVDWLRTGEGEMMRGEGQGKLDEMAQQPGRMIRQGTSDASLIDPTTQKTNIADLVAKTIEVLQSKTVFQTALESNIEAFHHAIVLERKIDQVEDRIMSKVSARLDALEAENKEIRVENQQLRHELEESRSQSAVRDTG
jgi:hypothetical protein